MLNYGLEITKTELKVVKSTHLAMKKMRQKINHLKEEIQFNLEVFF